MTTSDFPEFELDPPEQTITRNLIVLLLDVSGSMSHKDSDLNGKPLPTRKIDSLQVALDHFLSSDMHAEPKLEANGEIAIFTFGGDGVKALPLGKPVLDGSPFHFVRYVKSASKLPANGGTPIGRAISTALDEVERRKEDLARSGITHESRPNIFLLTDGAPTDAIDKAVAYLHAEEDRKGILIWALGTSDAVRDVMLQIANKGNYFHLPGNSIAEFLRFVSKSMRRQAGLVADDTAEHIYEDVGRNLTLDSEADRLLGMADNQSARKQRRS